MDNSSGRELTDLADAFLVPSNATHRQYEALRAYFVDKLPSAQAARRFGYTPGSFRVLCHEFRKVPNRTFFVSATKARGPSAPRQRMRERIVALRKQNFSVYEIRAALSESGDKLSVATPRHGAPAGPAPARRLLRRRDRRHLPGLAR